ncbi:MAG: translation elongation factor Ts [bacterium]
MAISASEVKALRDKTGAGIMDCKEALKECDGDPEAAARYLREKGLEEAREKTGQAAEGLIGTYLHMGGSIGVMVEVNCQTDFVAKTDSFKNLVDELCLQIAAQAPSYVSRDEVPEDVLIEEKEIIASQMEEQLEGKPDNIKDQILSGKLGKQFFEKEVLLEQPYIREPEKTVHELVEEVIADVDENVRVRRFARFEVGEGIEVETENFAEEVAKEIG